MPCQISDDLLGMVVCNTMENLLNGKPEMSGNSIAVEDVVFAGSQTDIVDNQGSVSDFAVGDDADVGRLPLSSQVTISPA